MRSNVAACAERICCADVDRHRALITLITCDRDCGRERGCTVFREIISREMGCVIAVRIYERTEDSDFRSGGRLFVKVADARRCNVNCTACIECHT